jgi:hypothetical protein
MPDTAWHQTPCILCSLNCGIEVRLEERRLAGLRGDKAQTALDERDWLAGTPWHKHVRARIEPIAASGAVS